ncbi:UNVERIFIED_CONTAM: hypothetical protein HDU68_007564 [Siphonaria sp. JEL0065]|nr:hypothetical protein HDU68_007564 [Siphonaria sp. JEL0065]
MDKPPPSPTVTSPTGPSSIAARLAQKKAALQLQLLEEAHTKETSSEVLPQLEAPIQPPPSIEKPVDDDELESQLLSERTSVANARVGLEQAVAHEREVKRSLAEKEHEIARLKEENEKKEQETQDARDSMTRLQKQLETVNSELHNSSELAQSSQSEETKYRILTLQFEKEKGELQKNVDWLNKEVERKGEELQSFRLSKQTAALKEKSSNNDSRISDLVSKLQESESRFIQSQEAFQTELNMQQSLANLYKSKSEEYAQRMQECLQSAHASQEEMDQAIRARIASEQSCVDLRRELAKRDERIDLLTSQVETLKQNGSSALSVLNPASQAAMSHQKSGKTFTEIYAEYSELKEENLRLKSETFRLNENLNSIVADINERAPIIKQAITDKRNLTKEVARLTSQLEESQLQQKTSQESIASLHTQLNSLKSKNRNVITENQTLNTQIQHLLLQVESGASSTTSPSQNQTLFSSIQDLQSQNSSLRSSLADSHDVIAKLTKENESLSRMRAATVELQDLRVELDKFKESLRVSELKAGSYKRERDQVKWLLDNNKENNSGVTSADETVGASAVEVSSSALDYEGMYKRLQTEFDEFRNETGTDTQSLKESNEGLMKAKNELEIHVVKLNSALDHLQERYKSLSEHSDFQKKEKDELHTRIHSLMDLHSSQELRMQELTNQSLDLRQRLDTTSNELNHVKGERDVISASETRFQTENAELVAQRNLATEHLKRLQGMFEDGEARMREAAEKVKEKEKALESQLALLRSEALSVREESTLMKLQFESEAKELQVQIARLTSQLEDSTKEVSALKETEQRLVKTIEQTRTHMAATDESLARYTSRETSTTTGSSESTLQALQDDLASTKSKLQTAQSTLESQKEHIEQYKAIAKAAEEKLAEKMAEFDASFATYRQETDEKLTELQAANSSLEKVRLESENRLSQALEELSEQRTQIDKDQIEFLLERSRMEDEMLRLRNSETSTQTNYKAISTELKKYKQRLSEAKTDYQKVVLLESERIKTLEELRGEVQKANTLVIEFQARATTAESTLSSERQTSRAKLDQLEKELDNLKLSNRDLTSQNATLHDQFESLSERLKSMHQQGASSSDVDESVHDAERANLIRHLRREKEILEKENDLAVQKSNRMQNQIDHLQRSLDETHEVLNQERKKNVNSEAERLHTELLSKIDRVNLLTESNSTLRTQNTTLSHQIRALETRIKVKDSEVGPLRDQHASMQTQIDTLTTRIHTLEEENGRLVNRASQILGKYSRVDPVEHQALKDQVSALTIKYESVHSVFEAEKSQLIESAKSLEANISTLTADLNAAKSSLASSTSEMAELRAAVAGKSAETANELEAVRAKLKETITNANNKMKGMIERLKEANTKSRDLTETVRVLEEKIAELQKGQASAAVVTTATTPVIAIVNPTTAPTPTANTAPMSVQTSIPVESVAIFSPVNTPATLKPVLLPLTSTTEVAVPSPKRQREEEPKELSQAPVEQSPENTSNGEMSESVAKRVKIDTNASEESINETQTTVAATEVIDSQEVSNSVDIVMNESTPVGISQEDGSSEQVTSTNVDLQVPTPVVESEAPAVGENVGLNSGLEEGEFQESGSIAEETTAMDTSMDGAVELEGGFNLGVTAEPYATAAAVITASQHMVESIVEKVEAVPVVQSITEVAVVNASAKATPKKVEPEVEPVSSVIKIQRTPIALPQAIPSTSTPINAPPVSVSTPATPTPVANSSSPPLDKTALLKQKLLLMQSQKKTAIATPVKVGPPSIPVSAAPSRLTSAPVPVALPGQPQGTPSARLVRPVPGRPVLQRSPGQQQQVQSSQQQEPQQNLGQGGAARMLQQQGLNIRPRGVRPVQQQTQQQQQQQTPGNVRARPQGNQIRVRPNQNQRPPPPNQ